MMHGGAPAGFGWLIMVLWVIFSLLLITLMALAIIWLVKEIKKK